MHVLEHHHVGLVGLLLEVEDRDDVRVPQLGGDARLAHEALDGLGIGGDRRQHALDHHRQREAGRALAARQIHHALTALGERHHQSIAPEDYAAGLVLELPRSWRLLSPLHAPHVVMGAEPWMADPQAHAPAELRGNDFGLEACGAVQGDRLAVDADLAAFERGATHLDRAIARQFELPSPSRYAAGAALSKRITSVVGFLPALALLPGDSACECLRPGRRTRA